MGERIDEWILKQNLKWWMPRLWWMTMRYINDNDLWTVSWFTTNKQVAVDIMTTIVRILAYSDATLFRHVGNSFAENPRTIFRFRAKFLAVSPSRIKNYDGLEFSAKPFAKRFPSLESLWPIINVAKKTKSVSLLFEKFHSQLRATNFVSVHDCCDCT